MSKDKPSPPSPNNAPARARARRSTTPGTGRRRAPPVPETLCTPDMIQQVAMLVASGAPLPLACPAAGLKWDTAKEWLKPDMRDREPYASFVAAVDKARATHAVGCTLRITQAARKGQWQADLAILERRHPEFFGRRVTNETVSPGERLPKEAEGAPVSDAELERIIREGAP